MPSEKCKLCGENVPWDNAGMGQTLLVVHENQHSREMNQLGLTAQQYFAYCKANYPRTLPDNFKSNTQP